MDGTTVSQEETLAMFSKFTSFMDYIRNQLVSNTELAHQVEALTAQVHELTAQVHSVVGQNTALQEAVNVITGERDQARSEVESLKTVNAHLEAQFNTRDNDANHWYAEFQRVSAELETVKAERSKLQEEHQALVESHDKLKAKIKQIQQVFGGEMATVEELQKRNEPQPRDPETQQWRGWSSQQTG